MVNKQIELKTKLHSCDAEFIVFRIFFVEIDNLLIMLKVQMFS